MSTGSKKTQAKLVESHGVLDADGLELAFTAACRSLKPAEVYDRFSPYLTAKVDEKKKDRDPAWAKREAICNDLSGGYNGHYGWYYRRYYATRTDDEKKTEWDPRWLDLAIKIKHMEVIHALARPNHTAVNKLLAEEFEASVKKSKDLHECSAVLDTMIRVGHPAATESLLAVLKKHAKGKYSWGVYWVGRLIPDLPKSALPELEALLPTLAEKAVDELMDYVQALRNKE
jgi:hypothetical protein